MEKEKIAILSHFGSFQSGYALHVGWRERALMLQRFDQDFDFLVNEGLQLASDTPEFPNMKAILGNISPRKPFEERVEFFMKEYRKYLSEYDVIFTADLIYQRGGNFLAQHEAVNRVAPELKAQWYHWIHSSWVNRPPEDEMTPDEKIRFTLPPKSTIVYMNYSDIHHVLEMYNAPDHAIQVVHNCKDPRSFYDFTDRVCNIIDMMKLPEKNVVQVFPVCSTRLIAKGIEVLAEVFGRIKKAGYPVALILANANASASNSEVLKAKAMLISKGLIDHKDYLFTSEITNKFPLERKSVAQLFMLTNFFCFPSWSEVSPQALLEAMSSPSRPFVLATNRVLPIVEHLALNYLNFSLFDATHRTPGLTMEDQGNTQLVTYNNPDEYFDELLKQIIPRIDLYHTQRMFNFSWDRIWHEQMRPLLYGAEGQ